MNTYGGVVVALVLLIPVIWAITSIIRSRPKLGGHTQEAITIVVFGALALVAIPSYQNYVQRNKILETLKQAEAPRSAVNEFFRQHKKFPPTVATTGPVRYEAKSGTVVVMFPNDVLDGKSVVFAPTGEEGRKVVWVCKSPEIPERDRKYLPEHCR